VNGNLAKAPEVATVKGDLWDRLQGIGWRNAVQSAPSWKLMRPRDVCSRRLPDRWGDLNVT
jgi:hypothetical protein